MNDGQGWLPAVASTTVRAPVAGPNHRATIIGTASEALVVRVDGRSGQPPTIATIITRRGVRQPAAIIVPPRSSPRVPALPDVEVGSPVELGAGMMTIGDLRLRVVRWWDPRLVLEPGSRHTIQRRADRLLARLDAATTAREALGPGSRLVCARQSRANDDATILGVVRERGDRLAFAWRVGRGPALDTAIAALMGLGPGTTPAGDDLLAGFTAMLAAMGDPRQRLLAAAVDRGLRDHGTPALSAALLRHAVAGRIALEARATMRWVAGGSRDGAGAPDEDAELLPTAALDRLLAIGATSGWALALGIALGARAWVLERSAPARAR